MEILFWTIVVFGLVYSFWYAFYLVKNKNKLGATGMALVGLLIGIFSFMVRLK
ncbi:hypothetical protein R4Z10_18210 [Niallia sp. XMNu-256]|uniref:hypothetical protein n=1 Tax=Niallia sp. XMNu-256 TaxID=3082444 RepID=UPI0030CBB820